MSTALLPTCEHRSIRDGATIEEIGIMAFGNCSTSDCHRIPVRTLAAHLEIASFALIIIQVK
ncbi:hypothetical protein ATO67_20535 [Agrobacterium bohemicum]|uniref:Uncharacterized protein n=1 Tax=Agrobacterium bohemicum TaxID=2052828 RepID=A0A135P6T8_9HYPH|nr:hypothetical protein ATO67_20535 [Agrobacterium bohemicum]